MPGRARNAEARDRYLRMRRRAVREDWLARLTGKHNDLLPYEAVAGILKIYEHRQLTEQRFIPLDKIVGSVGRYQSFTRSFLPRGGVSFDRWAGIEAAMVGQEGVPPIEVYQMGEVFFVADGNHRVAVARANGFHEIHAYVTRIPGDPGLEPGDSLDQAIIKVECMHFLAQDAPWATTARIWTSRSQSPAAFPNCCTISTRTGTSRAWTITPKRRRS